MTTSVSPDLVDGTLRALGLRFARSTEDLFAFSISTGGDSNGQLVVHTGVEGDVFWVRTVMPTRIAPDDHPRAVAMCNWWNTEHRWPTAVLLLDDALAVVVGVHHDDFPEGTSTEVLRRQLVRTITCSSELAKVVRSFEHVPVSGDIDDRFRELIAGLDHGADPLG
jgi:hypothetical protein